MSPPSQTQVQSFTADMLSRGGDFSLGFWVRPVGEESLVSGLPANTINGRSAPWKI